MRDFNKQFSKIILLLWKKAVLHTASLTHRKSRQVSHDPFSTNQENGSEMTLRMIKENGLEMTFVAADTKSNDTCFRFSQ